MLVLSFNTKYNYYITLILSNRLRRFSTFTQNRIASTTIRSNIAFIRQFLQLRKVLILYQDGGTVEKEGRDKIGGLWRGSTQVCDDCQYFEYLQN